MVFFPFHVFLYGLWLRIFDIFRPFGPFRIFVHCGWLLIFLFNKFNFGFYNSLVHLIQFSPDFVLNLDDFFFLRRVELGGFLDAADSAGEPVLVETHSPELG